MGSDAVTASGLTSANYAIAYVAGNLNVTPAPLTVTPANASKFYGAADPILAGTITGLQNNDPITAAYTTTADDSSAPGSFAIDATLSDPTSKLVNYTVTANTGTLTVAPAPLVVTVVDASKVYGSANPVFSVAYQGFALGQNSTVLVGTPTFSTIADSTSSVGTDAVAVSGLVLDQLRDLVCRGQPHPDPGAADGHPEQRQPGLRCRQPGSDRHDHWSGEW